MKRFIFVSYHHRRDRSYCLAFLRLFADSYRVIQDNSVERENDSDNADYVIRKIREEIHHWFIVYRGPVRSRNASECGTSFILRFWRRPM